jgi:hydroxyethylthiazole kinase
MPDPLEDETDFTEMTDFAQKLCFWEDLPDEDKARLTIKHWHFHPREFIKHFRKCGWLSPTEFARALSSAPAAGRTRAEALRLPMNAMLRKYGVVNSRQRTAHFLAQVGHETGWWQFREELGNARYFRTMYEVITTAEAAADYQSGLAQRLKLVQRGESEQAYAARRPGTVDAKAQTMDNGLVSAAAGGLAGDGPRFRGRGFLQITGRRNYTSYGTFRGRNFTSDPNPLLLASDDFNACDASGFYWSRERANVEADAGAAARNVTRVGGIVNRGGATKIPLHDAERQATFNSIWGRLNDAI